MVDMSKKVLQTAPSNKNIFDESRERDPSGALAVTNESREIAPDNFFNEENAKDVEDKNERKKMYEKTSKLKKLRARLIEACNKLAAKKIKNRIQKQSRQSAMKSSR